MVGSCNFLRYKLEGILEFFSVSFILTTPMYSVGDCPRYSEILVMNSGFCMGADRVRPTSYTRTELVGRRGIEIQAVRLMERVRLYIPGIIRRREDQKVSRIVGSLAWPQHSHDPPTARPSGCLQIGWQLERTQHAKSFPDRVRKYNREMRKK